jgi:hypothetical protein
MGVEAATVQRILRHSSMSVTTGTYVDVIEQFSARRSRAWIRCSARHNDGSRPQASGLLSSSGTRFTK